MHCEYNGKVFFNCKIFVRTENFSKYVNYKAERDRKRNSGNHVTSYAPNLQCILSSTVYNVD